MGKTIYLKRIVASYVKDVDAPKFERGVVIDPKTVFEQFKHLAQRDREEFITLHLDKGNRIICMDRVAVGTLDEVAISSREIFKTALLSNASACILIHNHPSERPNPSREDQSITRKIIEAGKLLDIRVMDHIIIAGDSYFSFSEAGILN